MSQPNIILLTIDSLRADHLGCYGYKKNTSPYIDALAPESMVFDAAFAAGIPTMPSFTTTLSGLHPYRHGITAHSSEQLLSDEVTLLPQLAKQAGYTTVAIDNLVVQGNGRGSWFARGFDYYSGFLYKPFSNQTEQLMDRAIRFVDEFQEKPFLLWAHLWDPHSPYGPPAPYDTMHYQPGELDGTAALKAAEALAPEYYQAFLDDMNLKVRDDYEYVVAQYDGEISYADSQVGRLFAHLKARGLWENTIIVLMSDHGEAFGESDIHFDHHSLYDPVIRVALMCRTPDSTAGRCGAMVSTEDIVPTLAEYCGLPLPARPFWNWTGESFLPALQGIEFGGREFLVCIESTRQASIALRTPQWKLIQPITNDSRGAMLPNIYGQERTPESLLFDLQNDPTETTDVAARFPQVREQLQAHLDSWRASEVARRGGDDPLLENGLSLDYNDFMSRLLSRRLRG